tara:strand:+ start:3993 stop:4454 length:462 start_codon:yes stop_codon:yes gene_type:complete
MPKSKKITTVEDEAEIVSKAWSKLELPEKIVMFTYLFLYIYLLIVVLASYDEFDKSSDPDSGMLIFYLALVTTIVTFSPVLLHYAGVSTIGLVHILGFIGVVTFLVMLWFILETYDKRELSPDAYKDPYSMSIYFLLISFSIMYLVGNIMRRF